MNSEKEKARQKYWEDNYGVVVNETTSASSYQKGFDAAWDIQQAKIDELVKALEKTRTVGTRTEIFNIIHEALNKHRGEK